jgi:hypothetical protein
MWTCKALEVLLKVVLVLLGGYVQVYSLDLGYRRRGHNELIRYLMTGSFEWRNITLRCFLLEMSSLLSTVTSEQCALATLISSWFRDSLT